MIARIALLGAALTATAATNPAGCAPSAHQSGPSVHTPALSGSSAGDVVSGTSFSRNDSRKTYYAECTTLAGQQYRVKVSADLYQRLQDDQPCPEGPHELLPKDEYPELFNEMQKQLPYGGGDAYSSCGEWQTVDKEEARRWAKECPPLKWGDLR